MVQKFAGLCGFKEYLLFGVEDIVMGIIDHRIQIPLVKFYKSKTEGKHKKYNKYEGTAKKQQYHFTNCSKG